MNGQHEADAAPTHQELSSSTNNNASAVGATADAPPFRNYAGFVMAAPMVRISVLGYRLFAARCGSDVVFSEELIAAKLAKCVRETRPLPSFLIANGNADSAGLPAGWDVDAIEALRFPPGSELVEYVRYEPFRDTHRRSLVFSTIRLPEAARALRPWAEGKPFILQMGVADPEVGARAAALVKDDVDGFDINMGCPKKFSVSNGMGAKLMEEPDRAAAILTAIRKAIGPTKPFSFKTRVFENVEDSVNQLSKCLATGAVHSVTLHARTRPQRSESKPRVDLAKEVVTRMRALFPHIAFIYNGSLGCSGLDGGGDIGPVSGQPWGGRAAILNAVRAMGFDGGLVARDAMWNPTVLLPSLSSAEQQGTCYSDDYIRVFRRMLQYHAYFGTSPSFLKYHITRTFGQGPLQAAHKGLYRALIAARNVEQFAIALGVDPAEGKVWNERHVEAEGDFFVVDGDEERPAAAGGESAVARRASTADAHTESAAVEAAKRPRATETLAALTNGDEPVSAQVTRPSPPPPDVVGVM